MVSSGLLRRVALVRTDVSEEPGASFIRVTKVTAVKTSNLTFYNAYLHVRNILKFRVLLLLSHAPFHAVHSLLN
jgi:hypothetical protein